MRLARENERVLLGGEAGCRSGFMGPYPTAEGRSSLVARRPLPPPRHFSTRRGTTSDWLTSPWIWCGSVIGCAWEARTSRRIPP